MGMHALRERVEQAVRSGESLDRIEVEIVDEAPLPADLRDALWLYAWGLVERDGVGDPTLN
jgi:hypothetical protein